MSVLHILMNRGGFGRCHVRQDDTPPARGAQVARKVYKIHPKGDSTHLPRFQTGLSAFSLSAYIYIFLLRYIL